MTTVVISPRWRLAATLGPVLVLFHFALVSAVIAAPGAIPVSLQPLVATYLFPVFSQDWRLFSPRPDVHDYSVYVRGSYRTPEGARTTPWLDLMEPSVLAMQANRLSPMAVRLEIVQKAALFTIRSAGPFGELGIGREMLAERWAAIEQQPASLIVLERLASAELAQVFPQRSFETVQVMVTARPVGGDDQVSAGGGISALLFTPVPFQHVTAR